MCGFAGTVRLGDVDLVRRMTALMAYRGPDDCGLHESEDVILGHRRLSVLDTSDAGHQPMVSGNGAYVIAFNGEIYNFKVLRRELEKKGHVFHTGTDTETILAAYQEFGPDCLTKLEGMFGFALWDRTRRQLLLARDHTGIKPVFYCLAESGLAFASEMKPLLYLPGFTPAVNRRALRSAIRFASNLENESMMASIFKLPPGHRLIWQDGKSSITRYWCHPVPAPESWDEEALAGQLRNTLHRAVQSHMISDVPLGAALSGGIDSSGIVALMARDNPQRIETFTVGHGADDPDLINARVVAEWCKTNHHEILVEAENVADLLPRVVWHLEEPLGQMESIQMYLNYREAAKFVKVLLIGEGADECFAGYARYRLLNSRWPLPYAMRRDLYHRVYMYADQQPASIPARLLSRGLWGHLPPSPLPDWQLPSPLPLGDCASVRNALECALNFDQRTYLHNLSLKRADAMGMAHSLELRVPFIDREVVELASRIPGRMLIRGTQEKYILRRALEPLLPPSITSRRKRGFQMRLNLGMTQTLDYLSDRLLRPADVRARGFFAPELVERLRRERPGRLATPMAHRVWSFRIWSVLMCELWARMFLDRPISPKPPERLADLL